MSLLTLINEIGEDADLLTRSDSWLEQERCRKATELGRVATELQAIQLAQKLKLYLQQRNMVAVQRILRDASGDVKNIIIKIMNLPDALSIIDTCTQPDGLEELNAVAQLLAWEQDGYDLEASAALRAS